MLVPCVCCARVRVCVASSVGLSQLALLCCRPLNYSPDARLCSVVRRNNPEHKSCVLRASLHGIPVGARCKPHRFDTRPRYRVRVTSPFFLRTLLVFIFGSFVSETIEIVVFTNKQRQQQRRQEETTIPLSSARHVSMDPLSILSNTPLMVAAPGTDQPLD